MKNLYIIILSIFIMEVSCKQKEASTSASENPLLTEFKTPFQVPPFDKIKNEHYMPAFEAGMKMEDDEIAQIVNNKDSATFTNTIEALDYSGRRLIDIQYIFFSLTSANTNDTLQEIQEKVTRLLTKHSDNIILNSALFNRVKTVYINRDKANLNEEQMRLLDKTYRRFVRNGAGLDSVKQKRLREINEQMASLSVKFGDNLLKETKAYRLVIDNKKDLNGLPESLINAAADDAKNTSLEGKWIFTLDNSSIMPFLTYAANGSLREKMLNAYSNRGNNNNEFDNKRVMAQIFNLRIEKAQLLGYNNFAALATEERMAKNPENVYNLLNKLWTPALKVAKREASDLQESINKDGNTFKLRPSDWRYYAEKVRKEKYDLDEEQIRPYFPLENVKQGAFMVANKLFGITFTEVTDIPKYNADSHVYEVKENDGKHVGILYMDFHPRASKRGGAWCGGFRDQHKFNGKNISPVVSIVCNFSKPTADAPSLLSFDETNTLFHEFGHALQALLSNVTYPGVASLVRDYVELPSQVMENWASDPEVINLYAKHYKTGKPIPKELVDKMMNSRYFNEGFGTVEYLAASILDMDYHTINEVVTDLDVLKFEAASMKKVGLIPEILPRYRTTYFNHISSTDYAAGYYVYVWAQVLDADAYQAFKENGTFDQPTAKLFRKYILEKGSSMDEMEAYKRFRGAEPSIEPLLKRKGFL